MGPDPVELVKNTSWENCEGHILEALVKQEKRFYRMYLLGRRATEGGRVDSRAQVSRKKHWFWGVRGPSRKKHWFWGVRGPSRKTKGVHAE